MSAPFSSEEQEKVREALIEAGKRHFAHYGIRKTTVDMLCTAANIAKGTFYRFYPSKEELFMDLIEEEEQEIHRSIERQLAEANSFEKVQEAIVETFRRTSRNGLLGLLIESGELALLARKLPEERLRTHREGDRDLSSAVIATLEQHGYPPKISADLIAAMLRGLFTVTFHREEVGSDIFPEAHAEMVRAVIRHAFHEGDYHAERR